MVWFMINDHIFDVANRGDEKDHTEMKEMGKVKGSFNPFSKRNQWVQPLQWYLPSKIRLGYRSVPCNPSYWEAGV